MMKKLWLILLVVTLIGCQEKVVKETVPETETSNPVASVMLTDVSFEDYEGNTYDVSFFKDSRLTVVNLWGTWCGPCVEEMPDLEKVYQAYKDKEVQILGIAIDSEASEVTALKETLGINYLLVKDNDALQKLIGSKFDYVPVTLFVNHEGEILSSFVSGSVSESQLKTLIDEALDE